MNKTTLRRIIREEIEKIEEAVAISKVRPLMKLNHVNKHRDEFFKKLVKLPNATYSKRKDRVYFPIGKVNRIGRLEKEISAVLSRYDYKLINYLKNIAETPKGQRIKMTKALARVGENDLLNFYSRQSKAKTKDVASGKLVCFSKHPYDLKGMSLGRKWEGGSCMAKSMGKKYIPVDVEKGTIVVYMIEADDLNLSNPVGRILLKQFINDNDPNDIKYFTESETYGLFPNEVSGFIENIMARVQNNNPGNYYELVCGLYSDGVSNRKSSPLTLNNVGDLEELRYAGYTQIHRDSKGRISVNDSMYMSKSGLSEFPFNVYHLMGNLVMLDNKITHLKWFPRIIDGKLSLSYNRIRNWKFGPDEVQELVISNNPLVTMEGSPRIRGNSSGEATIDVSNTKIKNFDGLNIDSGVRCEIKIFDMEVTASLKGLPSKHVYKKINHSGTPLENLIGIPERIEFLEVYVISALGFDGCKYVKRGYIYYKSRTEGDYVHMLDALEKMDFNWLYIETNGVQGSQLAKAVSSRLSSEKRASLSISY